VLRGSAGWQAGYQIVKGYRDSGEPRNASSPLEGQGRPSAGCRVLVADPATRSWPATRQPQDGPALGHVVVGGFRLNDRDVAVGRWPLATEAAGTPN